MDCQDTQKLIDGYVDGELDLVTSLDIERHLQDCPACALSIQNRQALRSAINAGSLYYRSPASLRKRVQASVRLASMPLPTPRALPWRWIGVCAAVAMIALLAFGLARILSAPAEDDFLAQQVVASHVRAMITDHLTDVASSDQHTVKPWFSGKLDFSPVVMDLASQGFPLAGGRVDYLDNRPVAALVYRHQQHVINLFIWPSPGATDTGAQSEMRQGYYVVHWVKSGMSYWAVSDLNESELLMFVGFLRS